MDSLYIARFLATNIFCKKCVRARKENLLVDIGDERFNLEFLHRLGFRIRLSFGRGLVIWRCS